MVAHGGIYLLNIVDVSCGGFPMLFCALAEVIVLNWIYGYDQFAEDLELMLGKKPNLYWKVRGNISSSWRERETEGNRIVTCSFANLRAISAVILKVDNRISV